MFDEPNHNSIEFPMPPVSQANEEALLKYAPLKRDEYCEFKKQLLPWLLRYGKAPVKSKTTVQQTHYKLEKGLQVEMGGRRVHDGVHP